MLTLLLALFEENVISGWFGLGSTLITGVLGLITLYLTNRFAREKRKKLEDELADTTFPVEAFSDIDDVKVRTALQHLNEKFDLAVAKSYAINNLLGNAFWESDASGQALYVSDELAELTGLEKPAILGNGWMSALAEEDREAVTASWSQAVAQRRDFYMDYTFVHRKHGKTVRRVRVNGRATAVSNTQGEIRFIGLLTELKD